jgi:acetylornithine/succinyldiaminopimelate/putrescine aminotransferase
MNQRHLFLRHLAQTSPAPLMLEIERAQGVYLYDTAGKAYFDLIAGIAVSNAGHCHPKIVEAIQRQAGRYMHTLVYGEFVQSPQVDLATRLASLLPAPLEQTYFVNSGTEAVEGAMKLAKRYTGRTEIVACYNAYHGSSQGALSIGGGEYFKQAYRPLLPDIRQIQHGNMADIEKITTKTACVIIEIVQGEAGVRTASSEYWTRLREHCTKVGALLVVDEIQTGFGRTGKLWAFEHYDFVPDVLLLAKGMGGGMPIGAFVSSQEIMQVFTENPVLGHITTFGGNPVCCASALANLDIIEGEKLYATAHEKAQLFEKLLVHPLVKGIRYLGLHMAVEFSSPEKMRQTITHALELGVMTDWFLYNDYSLRIAPPLIITEEEIHKACALLLEAMDRV